ncbi:Leucine-rich repeat transmembrane neuronal protein 3 [Holothuria leucospilota]|uniref:Leucine-rich repeat transmembrane neuronal protein 3 n=1 Tax=Holothuria leucospilota TaxID=206669 RepID=A0A9Q1H9G9_HOLLE|nr:Leucine-rich repeat transmembrane neuronal protein 3 [Holothuria leucospilota]
MAAILTLSFVLHLYQLCAEGSDQGYPPGLQCDCLESNVAYCVGKNLTYIPSSIALCEYTNVLNMSYNMLGSTKEPDCSNIPSSVRSLDLSFNLIETVRDVCIPGDATALRKLNISNNRISALNSFVFQSCPDLSYVDLSSNRISSIAIDSFSSLVKLNYLDLSHNVLTTLNLLSFDALEILLANGNTLSAVYLEEPLRLAFLNLDCNNLTHMPELDRSWRGNVSLNGNLLTCPYKSSLGQLGSFNLHCEDDQSFVCISSVLSKTAMYTSDVLSTISQTTPALHFIRTLYGTPERFYTTSAIGTTTTQNTLKINQLISFALIMVGFFVILVLAFLFGLLFSSPIRKCCAGFCERCKGARFPERNSSLNDTRLYAEIPNGMGSSPNTNTDMNGQRKSFSGAELNNICTISHVASSRQSVRCFDYKLTKEIGSIRNEIQAKSQVAPTNTDGTSAGDENNGYVPMKPID